MSGEAHQEARGYTVDELMVSVLSSFFEDGDQACNGMASFLPVCAFMLARLTHAPGLVWLASATGLEPRPAKVPASTLESELWSDSVMYMEQYGDFWNYAMNGRWLQKFWRGSCPTRHVRQRQQLGDRRRFPRSEGAFARYCGPRRHGIARQAPLLLEPESQPPQPRREGRLRLSSRVSGRR